MAPKKPKNLRLPDAVIDGFEGRFPHISRRRLWLPYTAAILAFLSLPKERRDHFMSMAATADDDNAFGSIFQQLGPDPAVSAVQVNTKGETTVPLPQSRQAAESKAGRAKK